MSGPLQVPQLVDLLSDAPCRLVHFPDRGSSSKVWIDLLWQDPKSFSGDMPKLAEVLHTLGLDASLLEYELRNGLKHFFRGAYQQRWVGGGPSQPIQLYIEGLSSPSTQVDSGERLQVAITSEVPPRGTQGPP
nr:hypothetical protein [Serinicoccus sediminis]